MRMFDSMRHIYPSFKTICPLQLVISEGVATVAESAFLPILLNLSCKTAPIGSPYLCLERLLRVSAAIWAASARVARLRLANQFSRYCASLASITFITFPSFLSLGCIFFYMRPSVTKLGLSQSACSICGGWCLQAVFGSIFAQFLWCF